MVELPPGCRPLPEQQFLTIAGTGLSWNQVLERDTAPCQYQALLQTNQTSETVQQFPFKVRLCTTDQAGANFGSENLTLRARGGDWCGLHLACNVHIAARVTKGAMSFVESCVTGMLNVSLTLSSGAALSQFRQALARLVAQRLVIKKGQLSADAREYRDFVLSTFVRTGARQRERDHLLRTVLNGDWRDHSSVQYWVPAGVDFDEGNVMETVTQAVLLTLAPSTFKVYPRHRWVGCDTAADQLALAECIHGLGSAAFILMCGQAPPVHDALDDLGSVPPEDAVIELPGHEQAGARSQRPLRAASSASEVLHNTPSQGAADRMQADGPANALEAENDAAYFAKENARRRAVALSFYKRAPLEEMMLMRWCLKPLEGCVSALEALLSKTLSKKLQQQSRVDEVMRLQKESNCSKPLGVLASAIAEVPYWQALLQNFVAVGKAMGVHKEMMLSTTSHLEQVRLVMTEPAVVDLHKACCDVRVLQEELPADTFEEMSKACLEKVLQFWSMFMNAAPESRVGLRAMETLLSESSLTFPFNKDIHEATMKMGEMLREAKADKKVHSLITQLQCEPEDIRLVLLSKDSTESLLQLCRDAEGLAIAEGQLSVLKAWWEKWANEWAQVNDMELELEALWYDVFVAMGAWLAGSQCCQQELKVMSVWHKLRMASHIYRGDKQEVKLMIDNDQKYEKLADLQSKLLLAEAVPEKAWKHGALQALMVEVKKLIGDAAKYLLTMVGSKLDDCVAEVMKLVGTPEQDGNLWHHGLDSKASWEDVCQKIKHVLEIKMKVIEEAQNNLEQAWLMTTRT